MTILADIRTRPWQWHRPATGFAFAMAGAAVLCVLGLLVDQRTLAGAPIWTKPLKFAISGALYFFTWSWLVSLLPRFRRTAWWVTTVLVALFAAEYVLLTMQAIRGTASHFNRATPFDARVFDAMAIMVAALFVATLILTVLLMFSRQRDRGTFWAVRFGGVISLVGLGLGQLMTSPTAEQLALAHAGIRPDMRGGHTVGLADGGPGLPVLGWSTVGGDLRIPHFVGMHALQLLPLLALGLLALAKRFPVLADGVVRAKLVLVGSAGYAGLVALVTWQAERGQSIVRPDGLTLLAFGALVLAVALGALASIGRPAKRAQLGTAV
ncbi:hypothetical protein [Amycolatopsis sp. NPDC059021]|uniref:hypothetical protein n=1 Tax=Amycolatopsis sp. NPDC059021 TaxID=3346704 RepID=UPI00367028F1